MKKNTKNGEKRFALQTSRWCRRIRLHNLRLPSPLRERRTLRLANGRQLSGFWENSDGKTWLKIRGRPKQCFLVFSVFFVLFSWLFLGFSKKLQQKTKQNRKTNQKNKTKTLFRSAPAKNLEIKGKVDDLQGLGDHVPPLWSPDF